MSRKVLPRGAQLSPPGGTPMLSPLGDHPRGLPKWWSPRYPIGSPKRIAPKCCHPNDGTQVVPPGGLPEERSTRGSHQRASKRGRYRRVSQGGHPWGVSRGYIKGGYTTWVSKWGTLKGSPPGGDPKGGLPKRYSKVGPATEVPEGGTRRKSTKGVHQLGLRRASVKWGHPRGLPQRWSPRGEPQGGYTSRGPPVEVPNGSHTVINLGVPPTVASKARKPRRFPTGSHQGAFPQGWSTRNTRNGGPPGGQ